MLRSSAKEMQERLSMAAGHEFVTVSADRILNALDEAKDEPCRRVNRIKKEAPDDGETTPS